MSHIKKMLGILLAWLALAVAANASELDLILPVLNSHQTQLLSYGLLVCLAGLLFGVFDANMIRRLPAHQKMLDISQLIFNTCKTYLIQQGKLLIVLEIFIAACIFFYFGFLEHV